MHNLPTLNHEDTEDLSRSIIGMPGWLSQLNICLQLRSGFQGTGYETNIQLPPQQGACFFSPSFSLCLCGLSLSLSLSNK